MHFFLPSLIRSFVHSFHLILVRFSPHLCVEFLFFPSAASSSSSRLLLPTHSHTAYSHTHSLPSHTTCSHTTLTHTTYSHPHTTCPHVQLVHAQLSHTQKLTHTHTTYQHTTYSYTQFTHTLSHTQLVHTQLVHTQLVHTHTQLTLSLSHTHTPLSRATYSHTHNSLAHNLFTHNLPTHTQLTHTQLTHTHNFAWASTLPLRGGCGAYGSGLALVALGSVDATAVCVAGAALCVWFPFDAVVAAAVGVPGVALGDIEVHSAWHAWHLPTSTCILGGRHGTGLSLADSGGALGSRLMPLSPRLLAWQAWRLATSTFTLRARCGTWRHRRAFCVAGVALMALGWLWWRAWFPFDAVVSAAVGMADVALGDIHLHFACQPSHTNLSHTHTALLHTTLSHATLSHTTAQLTTLLHTTLSHTSLSHTTFYTQLCHRQFFHTQRFYDDHTLKGPPEWSPTSINF